MLQYSIRRILQMMVVLLLVSLIVFLLAHVTGDPVSVMMGAEADPEVAEEIRADLGLDRPIMIQYFDWLFGIIQGDFGYSYRSHQPVLEAVARRLPVTLWMISLSFIFAIIVSIPMGIIAAMKYNSKIDLAASFFGLAGITMPSFFLAVLFIYIFSIHLGWLPPSGFINPLEQPLAGFKRLLMPSLTLGVYQAAVSMRMIRSSLLEVLSEDYIRTAKSKGLSEVGILVNHALKNAFIPVITIMGILLGQSFGGAVINETVFSLPGLGRLIVDNIFARDFPVVQGAVLIISLFFLLTNLIVDLIYGFLDPRIKYN